MRPVKASLIVKILANVELHAVQFVDLESGKPLATTCFCRTKVQASEESARVARLLDFNVVSSGDK